MHPRVSNHSRLTATCNTQAPTLKNVKLRYGSLQQFFDHLGADVVCLQETKLSSAAVTRDLACIPGWESFWSSSRVKLGYSGCATFVRLQYAACAAVTDFTFDGASGPEPSACRSLTTCDAAELSL